MAISGVATSWAGISWTEEKWLKDDPTRTKQSKGFVAVVRTFLTTAFVAVAIYRMFYISSCHSLSACSFCSCSVYCSTGHCMYQVHWLANR